MTPKRLAGIRENASRGVYDDGLVVSELLAHIATLEGFKREALAARKMIGSNYGHNDKDVLLEYHAARAANTPEAAIENLHEKYAQERIFRSRQTLSDNTKMENQ